MDTTQPPKKDTPKFLLDFSCYGTFYPAMRKDEAERKKYERDYYLKNAERIKARTKQWAEENRDKVIAARRKWAKGEKPKKIRRDYYKQNAEAIKAKVQAWRIANKDKFMEQRKVHALKNREKLRIYKSLLPKKKPSQEQKKARADRMRIERETCPQAAIVNRLRSRIRHGIAGRCKSAPTETLIGCTFDQARAHLGVKEVADLKDVHIDHVIPVAAFDLTHKDAQLVAFNFLNTQLLPKKENIAKKHKLPDDWFSRLINLCGKVGVEPSPIWFFSLRPSF
jgi:hypothetical protein